MEDRVYDTMFTEEISNKMQVPKSIKVNGDVSNFRPTSFNGDDANRFGDNFDMRVPEKIILLGKFFQYSAPIKLMLSTYFYGYL